MHSLRQTLRRLSADTPLLLTIIYIRTCFRCREASRGEKHLCSIGYRRIKLGKKVHVGNVPYGTRNQWLRCILRLLEGDRCFGSIPVPLSRVAPSAVSTGAGFPPLPNLYGTFSRAVASVKLGMSRATIITRPSDVTNRREGKSSVARQYNINDERNKLT